MKKAIVLASCLLHFWVGVALAQSIPFPGPGMPASTSAGCTAATNFLARTSLTGSDVTNYTNLICGLVTDGLITGNLSGGSGCGAPFDAIYIFATHDATTALLNICGTNYSALNGSSLTFTAYSGFTGDGVQSHVLNTQFNPVTATSPNFVQNSAHLSVWNLTNATSAAPMINDDQLIANNIFPKFTDNNMYARINDGASAGFSITDPRGHILGNRSSSTARQAYQNASTTLIGGTAVSYGSVASSAPSNTNIELLSNGNAAGTTDQVAMSSIGGSLTSGQVTSFYNRLRTYMTAVGVP